jgi:hypothetical protein
MAQHQIDLIPSFSTDIRIYSPAKQATKCCLSPSATFTQRRRFHPDGSGLISSLAHSRSAGEAYQRSPSHKGRAGAQAALGSLLRWAVDPDIST